MFAARMSAFDSKRTGEASQSVGNVANFFEGGNAVPPPPDRWLYDADYAGKCRSPVSKVRNARTKMCVLRLQCDTTDTFGGSLRSLVFWLSVQHWRNRPKTCQSNQLAR